MTGNGNSAPPASAVLTDILRTNYLLHRTSGGRAYATAHTAPSVYLPFSELRGELSADYYTRTGRPASANALAETIMLAEAVARRQPLLQPSLRIAGHGDSLYLDLGRADGKAVQIAPYGWRVVDRPPVVFMRTNMTAELPLPAERGSADGIRDLINVQGSDEWALFIACRIASLLPGITHPVELFTGPAGSAKTGTMRLAAKWIDPSHTMIPVPRDGRSWSTVAGSAYCLPVDNISFIPAWWSDLLCKAASGDGWVDRALYTDGEVFVSRFQAVVMLNGITFGQIRGDLADRMVVHRLEKPRAYRSDDEIEHTWTAFHPAALAWLLDQTVCVMRDMLHQPYPRTEHRLARFEQVVSLLDARWRTRASDAWLRSRNDMATDVAEGDAVAVAIMQAIQMPTRMSTADLCTYLQMHGGLTDASPGHPWTPMALTNRIERSRTALQALGWQLTRIRAGDKKGTRMWELVPPGWYWDGLQWAYQSKPGQSLDRI